MSLQIYNNIREQTNFRDERQNFTNEIYELHVLFKFIINSISLKFKILAIHF